MLADFQDLRTKMVDNQIRTTNVTDYGVLDAFLQVPREEFVPADRKQLAYIDEDILIGTDSNGSRRYLMEPSPLAKLVQLAEITPDDIVLNIGSGCGYSCAILSLLAGSVIGLEENPDLVASSSAKLSNLGYDNVVIVSGELQKGYASEAPYNVIMIEGSVDYVPEVITNQLRDGGRLIAVEGHGNTAIARVYLKEDNKIAVRDVFNIAIKPLPGFQRAKEFVF